MTKESRVLAGIILFVLLSVAVAIVSLIKEVNILFSFVLIVWLGIVSYCMTDIKTHIVLFCFSVSFFVFLIGRELCFAFFGLPRYYTYLDTHNNITFFLMIISMLSLMIGYIIADRYSVFARGKTVVIKRRTERMPAYPHFFFETDIQRTGVRKAAEIAFYFCLACSLLDVWKQIQLVRNVGYTGTYMAANTVSSGVLAYFASFTIVALSIFLATCPPRKSSWTALMAYEAYGVLTMLTGHRYTFVAISMYFLTYIIYRHKLEGHWISKSLVIAIVIAAPFVIVLMNVIDTQRGGRTEIFNGGTMHAMIRFLDQQGGSVNCIKRIFYYKDKLSDMIFTSLSNTRAVLFENAILRRVFGIQVYSGNSLENALNGHYLSHRLSWYEYGELYLRGHGVGSCYIAELFHDFGVIGVMLGNLIYGYVIRRTTDIGDRHYFGNALVFASQYYIYLAPRGDFDGMIGGLFSVTSILGMIGIWVLSYCLCRKGIWDDKSTGQKSISVVFQSEA